MIPSASARTRAAHAAVATVLAGLLTYVILALVSRTVPDVAFDQFSVFWSLALIVGFGFFLPVEQEAARLGRDGSVAGQVVPAMMRVSALVVVVVAIGLAAALPVLTGVLELPLPLALATIAVVVASGIQFAGRARLLIQSRVTAFTNTLILDTVLRVALLGAVAVVVVTAHLASPATWYAAALVLTIVLAHAWAVPWTTWRGASREVTTRFRRAVVVLIATSLCAQILVNAGPILVQALSDTPGTAGAFQASSTLARIPLAMITPVQAMLVGPLAALVLAANVAAVASLMRRVALWATAAAVVAGVGAFFLGPWIVELIFGRGRALGAVDLTVLVVGTIVHVALIIFTQAMIAAGRHRTALIAWAAALAVGIVVFVIVTPLAGPVLGAGLGFGVGSLLGAGVALASVLAISRSAAAAPEGRG